MDEFLGESGKATIVLLKLAAGEKPPSIRELKRDLEVDSIKYYKGDGWYRHAIGRLVQLMRIRDQIEGHEFDWTKFSCTDFLHLDPDVQQHPFYFLKHTDKTLGGFNLTNESFDELNQILRAREEVISMQSGVEYFHDKISKNIVTATKYSLTDRTLLEPQLTQLANLFEGYGKEGLNTMNTRLEQWYQTYKWKSKSFIDSDSSNNSAEEAIVTATS